MNTLKIMTLEALKHLKRTGHRTMEIFTIIQDVSIWDILKTEE